jgi:PhnB protein
MTYTSPDYHHVTPYLSVKGAPEFVDFVVSTLGATAGIQMTDDAGAIVHGEVKIGDSTIMFTEDCEYLPAFPAALYVYVPDVDATHAAAVAAGCTSQEEPNDKPYGDRTAGVVDQWGIRWYLATHL